MDQIHPSRKSFLLFCYGVKPTFLIFSSHLWNFIYVKNMREMSVSDIYSCMNHISLPKFERSVFKKNSNQILFYFARFLRIATGVIAVSRNNCFLEVQLWKLEFRSLNRLIFSCNHLYSYVDFLTQLLINTDQHQLLILRQIETFLIKCTSFLTSSSISAYIKNIDLLLLLCFVPKSIYPMGNQVFSFRIVGEENLIHFRFQLSNSSSNK